MGVGCGLCVRESSGASGRIAHLPIDRRRDDRSCAPLRLLARGVISP